MRVLPVGADALLVEFDTPEQARAWQNGILRRRAARTGPLAAVREVVPGDRTVLLYGISGISNIATAADSSYGPDGTQGTHSARSARTAHGTHGIDGTHGAHSDAVAAVRAESGRWSPPAPVPDRGPLLDVPVRYDGPDLAAVARLWGVSEDEVVRVHSSVPHLVAFCGFAPGFAYLTGLDARHHVPRRAAPRTLVPAGSVALAGPYTGVYPRASPGGWQLIGSTDVRLWDPAREPAALLTPGTRVRFVPQEPGPGAVPRPRGRRAAARAKQAPHRATPHRATPRPQPPHSTTPHSTTPHPETPRPETHPHIEIVRAGALTTVQDLGRAGHSGLGVPRSGALDGAAHRLANRLVGNPAGAATLETTLTGATLRVSRASVVAVTGAPAAVRVDGRPAAWASAVRLPAGAVLDVGAAVGGLRGYVAVDGGITTAPVLGSRATDLLSGLGHAPLQDGDVLPLGAPGGVPRHADTVYWRAAPGELVLPVLLGPRHGWFTAAALRTLWAAGFTVSPRSNRIALRTAGPSLERAVHRELPSEGMVVGAVQVPPDGRPVVLLADGPTTGGYPVIGVVPEPALAAAAQALPGVPVRFVPATRHRTPRLP